MAGGEGGWWTFTVFVLICVVFGLAAHDFFSRANWVATSEYAVEYLLLAVGQTFVIATAGIDLSCGAILGFSAMLAAVIMSGLVNGHVNSLLVTIVGCLIAVLSGALIGALNGLLITKLRITPFIVTLGMLGMATGGTYLLDDGNQVSNLPAQIGTLGRPSGWAAGCPPSSWWPPSSRLGLAAAVPDPVRDAHLRDRQQPARRRASGGEGRPAPGQGVRPIGTFIISILVTGLILLNVQPFWQEVAVGAVLILAVVLDQLRRRLADE